MKHVDRVHVIFNINLNIQNRSFELKLYRTVVERLFISNNNAFGRNTLFRCCH